MIRPLPLPYFAGLRISEVVGPDLTDTRLSARKGELRIRDKGRDGKIRHLPVHPDLRQALSAWLEARADWKSAGTTAVFLNQRGGTHRAARDIVTGLGEACGINGDPTDPFGPHVLRHILRHPAHPRLQGPRLGRRAPWPRLAGHHPLLCLPTEAGKAAALDALITDH